MKGCEDVGSWTGRPRAQTMMKSDEVEAMLRLHALGWGLRRIAREFGCSRNTVRRYVAADGWTAYRRRAGGGRLETQEAWRRCGSRRRRAVNCRSISGSSGVPIADERVRVYLFVATLGYSLRCHVAAFRHERQSSWFRGLEGAFGHFGACPGRC